MSLFETKKLREECEALNVQQRSLAEKISSEKRAFSQEELTQFDQLRSQEQDLWRKIETQERLDQISKPATYVPEFRNVTPKAATSKRDRDLAFRAVCLRSVGQPVPHEWEATAQKCGVDLNSNSFKIRLLNEDEAQERAMSSTTGSEGGYLTNDSLMPSLEKSLKYFGGIRQACRVIRTSTGTTLNWPTMDDTSTSATIGTQNVAPSTQDVTFGQKTIGCFRFQSPVFPVPHELLRDAQIPVGSIIGEALGERISRKQNTDYTTGAGGGSVSEGIVTASTAGKTADSATVFTWEEVIDLIFSVDKAYRDSPNFGLMMHDSVYAYLLKLEDSQGRPLYLPSLHGDAPKTWLGYKVHINNDMASTLAANAKVILAGDFSKGIVRDVSDIEVNVLRERYADQFAVGYFAAAYGDFKLLNTSAVKHLKLAAS